MRPPTSPIVAASPGDVVTAEGVGHLTPTTQDYLKALWSLGEWDPAAVTVTALAARLGVRTSTASDGLRKLAEQGFAEHAPYGEIRLTAAGTAHALAMVRRHRLLETFLESQLGYSWDEVHDEAESLEHAVSDVFVERIDALLGHPTRDPHGDVIPPAAGAPPRPTAVPLAALPVGASGIVVRVSDASPERLRRLAASGILPDAVVTPAVAAQLEPGDDATVWVIPQRS